MNRSFVLAVIFLMGMAGPSFAGIFTGVGGDADFFPRSGPIGSIFMVPVLNQENVSGSLGYGFEGVIGWSDLSFSLKYGRQGSLLLGGIGIRKKILGEDNMPFSCALLYDVDGTSAENISTSGSYLGAIFSKRLDKISPYIAVLSTTYYIRTDFGVGPITYQYIYGSGLAGGARYDYDNNWSIRGEFDYNVLATKPTMPWPKSVMSVVVAGSYKI